MNNGMLKNESKLKHFTTVFKKFLMSVGGRLKRLIIFRHLDQFYRNPSLIPRNIITIANLVLHDEHRKPLQAGPNERLKYWIIGAKNMTRHIYHKCNKCFQL